MMGTAVSLHGIEKRYQLYRSSLERCKEALHPFRKRYAEEFAALKGIDLEIPRGETWGIIGLNGSGKSTLLKIICGVIQPSAGRVQVNGRISALLELGSGFNPEYTGRENLFFAGVLAGFSRVEMEARFPEIAAFAEIGEFMDQPVKNYSSGMLMRLAFAVSVHIEPDILVIDEALAVGDARFQHKCIKKIKEFQNRSTIILVTHDLNAVLTLCDRVAWLHQGELLEVGPPKEITDRYTQAFYEGEPVEEDEAPPLPQVETISAIEVFDKAAAFGTGQVIINKVALLSRERNAVEAVYGGEAVALYLWLRTTREIKNPIVGFLARNRLGIELFGFNNISLGADISHFREQKSYLIKFAFTWPLIAADHYSISVAVAEGEQEQHIMHHWIYDVMSVEVLQTTKYQLGLLQVQEAEMEVKKIDG
jgi:ABC-type polysaccharide/polyol phosphate transport system ATPase subunit